MQLLSVVTDAAAASEALDFITIICYTQINTSNRQILQLVASIKF